MSDALERLRDVMDTLRREVLETKVDTSQLQVEDREQARRLGSIIGRLLNKNPDNRYPTAWRVIRALCEAIGKPIPSESQGIRDSFLQAAKFIGREKELTTLNLSSSVMCQLFETCVRNRPRSSVWSQGKQISSRWAGERES